MLKLHTIKLMDGSENLFYLAYGMPQSRTSRRAAASLFGDLLQFLSDPKSPQSETNRGALQHDDYKIYPVPSSETITIQYDFAGNEDAIMNLYDILGREIETIQLSNTNTLVSFSILTIPNGVYTYKIKVGKETKTGKIQILK